MTVYVCSIFILSLIFCLIWW